MPAKTPRQAITARSGACENVLQWTPKLVGVTLITATRWIKQHGGPVGPRPIRSCVPSFTATLDDHLAEGWGLPEIADENDLPKIRAIASPAQVSRHLAALEWPATYLGLERQGSGRMLGLWVACKARKLSFSKAIGGRMATSHAFRLRDRGLSLISIGLDRDGVPVDLP